MARRGLREPRPVPSVVLRALVAGAGLGAVFGAGLVLLPAAWRADALHPGDLEFSAVVLLVAAAVGAVAALVAAAVWLAAAYGGLGRLADPFAGVAAALVSSPLWFSRHPSPASVAWLLATGSLAALVARWQGYARGPRRELTPRSSPRGG